LKRAKLILSLHTGYLLAIDMTGRNVQEEAKKKGLPWSIAKGFDTFLPVSNYIPKSQIPDPHNAHIWLSVNDEIKQSDNTELMLFRIPRQLSDISKVMDLEPGDIVLTGTPKGVGPVKSGDVMKAGLKIDGKDVPEASIEVNVVDREGPYEFMET
jgi:acylpyruvate hydrolase